MARGSRPAPLGAGFLLTQLGTHAAASFAHAIASLGITPPHLGLLRAISAHPDRSQQAIAEQFDMPASRLVTLLDELEERNLVERRRHPNDRRMHLVRITAAGDDLVAQAMAVGVANERRLLAALSAAERRDLARMLTAVADEQGLTRGVHPGYRTLGRSARTRADPPCSDPGHDQA